MISTAMLMDWENFHYQNWEVSFNLIDFPDRFIDETRHETQHVVYNFKLWNFFFWTMPPLDSFCVWKLDQELWKAL